LDIFLSVVLGICLETFSVFAGSAIVSNESEKQYEDDRERLLEEIRRRAEEAELKRLDEEDRAQRQDAEPPTPIEEPLVVPEVPPPSHPPPPPPVSQQPEEPEIQPHELLQEAQQFYQHERYDKALELVEKVLKVFPGLGEASRLHEEILKSRQLADVVRSEEARHRAEHLKPLPPPPPEQIKVSSDRSATDFWGPGAAEPVQEGITAPPVEQRPTKPPRPPLLDRTVARLSRVRIPVKPILIGCASVVAVAIGYIIIDSLVHAVAPPQHVLLVMPASSASAEESQVLLADGFTDDIIQTIGRAPDLRVIGAQSALNSRTLSVRPQQLARNLKAGFVLELNIRESGELVGCAAVVSDTTADTPRWKRSFEGSLSDLASFRLTLAREIAEELHIQLPTTEDPLAAQTQPRRILSYGLYLQARGLLHSASPAALQRAKELLQSVVQTDSSWGEGWAALGWASMLAMEKNPYVPKSEAVNALGYIQRAVARGGKFAETFRVWGMIEIANANYAKAVERYQSALELCPGDAETLYRQAFALMLRGKKEDALQIVNTAVQWDPLNPELLTAQGLVRQFNADLRGAEQSYARAMQVSREQADLAADLHTDVLVYLQRADDAFMAATDRAARQREDPLSHYRLGRISQIAGQPIQAWQTVLRQTLDLTVQRLRTAPDDPEMLMLQALTYTRLGQRKDALDAQSRAFRAAPASLDVLYGTARMFALQRDQKQATAYLTQAVDRRYDPARILDMDFYNLRADQDFLRAVTR
jgi:TolB-like protein/Flp pilus assembly protein TadD